MSLTALTIHALSAGAWELRFASDAEVPIFRIFRDGLQIGTTQRTRFAVHIEPGEFPVFEVLDQEDGEPNRAFPPGVTLGWFTATDVDRYLVYHRENDSAPWELKKTILHTGQGYIRWTSGPLADVTTHRFRIDPIGVNGNLGESIGFLVLIVRIPDPPVGLTFTYDPDTQVVTIDD